MNGHLSLALLLACDGRSETSVAGVAVAPTTARLPVGSLQFMTILAKVEGRLVTSGAVKWESRNTEVARVSDRGVITAMAPGGPVWVVGSVGVHRDSTQITVVTAGITSRLRRSSLNPRYFTDSSNRAVYLTGAHTWQDFQDVSLHDPPTRFDWPKYLNFLRAHNLNFTELWRWEQAKWIAGFDSALVYYPVPYLRTGPGAALDGKRKFDLRKFDPVYFERMRQRVAEAGRRGIYVSIMLFDGWSIERKGFKHGNPWPGHPFHRDNNINGVDGDPDRDDQGLETHTMRVPAIVELQDDYVRRVIDAVGDLDNVLYEVSNETTGGPEYFAWQQHVVSVVRAYESQTGKSHPVGITALYPDGNDGDLYASDADFISPATTKGVAETPPASSAKVVLWDTDHLCGNCGDGAWVWRSFTRGTNPVFMDVYDGSYPVTQLPRVDDPRWESARRNMGYTLAYANRMRLTDMTPAPQLCSSHYCLASPRSAGAEYLVYLNGAKSVRVDLSPTKGTLAVEWFDPTLGRAFPGGSTTGGGVRVFPAPRGSEVLYLRRIQ